VLRDLVLAGLIEPTSKADAVRVLAETGIESTSYRTVKRHLREIAKPAVREALSAVHAAHAGSGPASLMLYDVSALYSKPIPATDSAIERPNPAIRVPTICGSQVSITTIRNLWY
jgi:hypothetical protein